MAGGLNGPRFDPVSRRILEEMRGIHGEMRDMKVEMRDLKVEMRDLRVELREDRRRTDERFDRMMADFRADSQRRHSEFVSAFREVRAVGLSIVKTLNLHTRILTRIDRKLGARDNGGPGRGDGRGL